MKFAVKGNFPTGFPDKISRRIARRVELKKQLVLENLKAKKDRVVKSISGNENFLEKIVVVKKVSEKLARKKRGIRR